MDDGFKGVNGNHLYELLTEIQVGFWDWNLTTGGVIYSTAWAGILNYTVEELPQTVETWENMVLAEDLPIANEKIELHLAGELPLYEAEFRMVCKDGSIIWAQDRGRVTEWDADGNPTRFVGVLQDVTRLKMAELTLLDNQETLDLAVNVAGLGTWDWDIKGNMIRYNDEYLQMLGYVQSDIDGSIEEWENMNHPEDLVHSAELLADYIAGKIPSYECEIRMKHKDGHYIWTKDVGRIAARDNDGQPIRLIGGHLNIDDFKTSKERLSEALQALEHNKLYLEKEIENRTRELVEQDKMLWTVNQISRQLLVFNPQADFDMVVQDCLRLLGESINRNRVYIWRDHEDESGELSCTQIYEWVEGTNSIQGVEDFECIPYRDLPNFVEAIDSGRCLNGFVRHLSDSEREILDPQGIKTVLIAPVAINGKRWGFIGVDNCEEERLFSEAEENMLFMSGSMLANTIEKMETEAKMREMEERTQIMLDAMPLCCNLWSDDFQNMRCNEEAVRLFDMGSQQEYLERFNDFSPEFQPDGQRSSEKAIAYIKKAFKEGYCKFEWMHQKLDGTPIPSEVILVRIRYKDSFIVSGYTRDLRELKATLAELQAKEDALRIARDEALLSSRAKSNFLANMSHEIRTPMNAISGLAEIILRESHDQKTSQYAKGIRDACGNLLNIINDILDISKIESGKLEIINSQYELSSLLNDVITISRMRLGDKPLMFTTDIDSRLPAKLMGDEIRIRQVLINMLSNAIKFTQSGYIALRISGELKGDKAILRFSVSDSGVGIKEADLERLFAEFERVNTTKNRTIEGTGLGLSISKQLCEMMGGDISVTSVYGKGSEFVATIPQDCPEYEPLSVVEQEKTVLLYEPRERYRRSITETIENLGSKCISCSNQSELYESLELMPYDYIVTASLHLKKVQSLVHKNKLDISIAAVAEYGESIADDKVYSIFFPVGCLQISDLLNGHGGDGSFSRRTYANANFTAPSACILVVDDNPVNLSVASGLMEPYLFSIDTAVNGLEAVAKIQSKKYDLVFMDHMMPEMDGIDATTEIRRMEDSYYKELPIIALTANALVGTREMFIREGMNDFLAKPIEINKLGNILAKWLPKNKIVRRLPGETVKAKVETLEWKIEGVDTEKGIISVGGSKENYLNILSVYYNDGCQKIPLILNYATEKKMDAFRTEVHALKSASATIGAAYVSSLAAKLEAAAKQEDIEFIDDHLDEFLTSFQGVLEGLKPVVAEVAVQAAKEAAQGGQKEGDTSCLKERLIQLQDAADFANVGLIEEIMNHLKAYTWKAEVAQELTTMGDCLAMFDYDGILECVERMKKL